MELAPTLAQEIVIQMKNIIHQEINFINKQAVIIASTDPCRIGELHGGAKQVIKTKRPLTIDTHYSYIGSKKGINMPIYFDKEIIGVIGITGDKKKVQQHGEIIKKMTEILIKEDYLKDIFNKQRERFRYIINSLLNPIPYNKTTNASNTLGYDYSVSHIAVIGKCELIPNFPTNDLFKILEKSNLLNDKHIYTIMNNQIYILFKEESSQNIQNILHQLNQEIYFKSKLSFRFGIGLVAESEEAARQSFDQASDALKWVFFSSKSIFMSYKDMGIGNLYAGLPEQKAHYYVNKILSDIPIEEKEELKHLLFTYGNMNKSMTKSAQKLFLHKNTFQYKLNKFQTYTGYDPKVVNDYVILYSAFILEDIQKKI